MNAITSAPNCPAWCQNDHAAEPADHHVGEVTVSAETWLLVSDIPGEGFAIELHATGAQTTAGAVTLNRADVGLLAKVLGDIAA